MYKVRQKNDTILAFEFSFLLDALHLHFLFIQGSFPIFFYLLTLFEFEFDSNRLNDNFVTVVALGLTNDERSLIHNLRVEKQCMKLRKKNEKMFSSQSEHRNCK